MKDSQEKSEIENLSASTEASSAEKAKVETRRNFIKKYGALAAITPVAMSMTMHSKKALASSMNDDWAP